MDSWPIIPEDVVSWFRSVFAEANRRVCERLVNVPNIRETSLDDGLVEALIPDTAPMLLPSGAIVRMDTHNIGGLRRIGPPHWDLPLPRRWETADIAILVFVYRRENLIAKKIGLLQSKRLYPENNDVDDDDEIGFLHGMNAFIRRQDTQAVGVLHRSFAFSIPSSARRSTICFTILTLCRSRSATRYASAPGSMARLSAVAYSRLITCIRPCLA
jgi:hypothetical protein